ncbi:MAG: hypothetical protein IPO04_00515 [Cytophagaceae bacterium]|nr:hypothetical protein [Cytophagaceae bacterium]
MPDPLKILIVEDHKNFVRKLALLVGTIDGVEVIGKLLMVGMLFFFWKKHCLISS